jgi:hypothetical protein
MQTLMYATALFGRLAGGAHARKHALDAAGVKRGIRLLGECLSCDEPDVMLAAVRALKEISLQSGNWAAVAGAWRATGPALTPAAAEQSWPCRGCWTFCSLTRRAQGPTAARRCPRASS